MYGKRLERWDKAAEWPLMGAAVLFLIAYAVQILVTATDTVRLATEVTIWVTWGIFAIDYVVRLVITENRWKWFYHHLLDLAIVALPLLRPLRLMRFLTILAIVQRGAGNVLRGKVMIYTVGATALTIVVAGLAVLDAERGNGGPIQSLGDAVWWAFVTITTVGYGDYFPVTVTGRIVAVGLMVGGIALIGVVTATLASWIVEKVSDDANKTTAATSTQVDELRGEVAELKDMIRALQVK
ncbi:voltage-gated potassium channel [Microbacterium halimionae]|uniref:Voltage-gated potassium channel n=1 Tax=Microbacterium halimionae TaxID=1526413 RepID=A0A7W3PLC4_9MICO|nr:potassium channel family protein [Microbacterium halimionae]MBA8815699.1 voltage-gated potassium channel [Microbacterium halimionae]NII95745.1 voltage-gated potassium channel [Microbacterium halimionae]